MACIIECGCTPYVGMAWGVSFSLHIGMVSQGNLLETETEDYGVKANFVLIFERASDSPSTFTRYTQLCRESTYRLS